MIDRTSDLNGKKLQFPRIVDLVHKAEAAAQEADGWHWRIGDALIAECGPPGARGVNTGAGGKLKTVASELKRLGHERYSLVYLRKLRNSAARFPDDKRLSSVPWSTHLEAGDPETLEAAQKEANRQKVQLTGPYVKKFKRQRRREEDRKPHSKGSSQTGTAGASCTAEEDFLTHAAEAREHADYAKERIRPYLDRLSRTEELIKAARAARLACEEIESMLRQSEHLGSLAEAAE